MTTKKLTKEKLIDEAWDEYEEKEEFSWKELGKKIKEIEEKFKDKCEVCGK